MKMENGWMDRGEQDNRLKDASEDGFLGGNDPVGATRRSQREGRR